MLNSLDEPKNNFYISHVSSILPTKKYKKSVHTQIKQIVALIQFSVGKWSTHQTTISVFFLDFDI